MTSFLVRTRTSVGTYIRNTKFKLHVSVSFLVTCNQGKILNNTFQRFGDGGQSLRRFTICAGDIENALSLPLSSFDRWLRWIRWMDGFDLIPKRSEDTGVTRTSSLEAVTKNFLIETSILLSDLTRELNSRARVLHFMMLTTIPTRHSTNDCE